MKTLLTATFLAIIVSVALPACDKGSGAAGADGGKPVKRACKMMGSCYLCPDDEAMKKCILNPGTSGCKPTSMADCEH